MHYFFIIILFSIISCSHHPRSKRALASTKVPPNCEQLLNTLAPLFNTSSERNYVPRLKDLVSKLSEKELTHIFSPKNGGMTYEEFSRFYWEIKSKKLKINPQFEALVEDLFRFTEDYGPVFWTSSEKILTETKSTLLKAESFYKYAESSFKSAPALDSALQEMERTVIARALGEHAGKKYPGYNFGQKFVNYFFPHYSSILDFHQMIGLMRKKLQIVSKADEPIEDALIHLKEKYQFLPHQIKMLESLIANTPEQYKDITKVSKRLFSQELKINSLPSETEMALRLLYKNAKSEKEIKFDEGVFSAEQDLDSLENVLNESRARLNLPGPHPTSEWTPIHLQIRNNQYLRERNDLEGQYYNHLQRTYPKDSEYNVDATWTITVQYLEEVKVVTKNDKGEEITTSQDETRIGYVNMRGTFSLDASYEEIIARDIDPSVSEVKSQLPAPGWNYFPRQTSATNETPTIVWVDDRRVDYIFDRANKARDNEMPARNLLSRITKLQNKSTDDYTKIISNEKKLTSLITELRSIQDEVKKAHAVQDKYLDLSDEEILQQWHEDSVEHFKTRNQTQLERFEKMEQSLDVFTTIFEKKLPSLMFEYDVSPQDIPLNLLNKTRMAYRIQQGVMALLLVTGGTAATIDVVSDGKVNDKNEVYHSKIKQFLDYLETLPIFN